MRVVVSSNSSWNVLNFRRPIVEALIARGDEVVVVAPEDWASKKLIELGCNFSRIDIDPKGISPARDAKLLVSYLRTYARERPATILHFTIKPVIYGTLAARFLRITAINTITGLGTAFIESSVLTRVAKVLYRLTLPGVGPVVFHNSDDLQLFRRERLVTRNPCIVVPGSGIDLSEFAEEKMLSGDHIVFLMIARLLRDKGVQEFVEAARQVRLKGWSARFQLLGPIGVANRTALSEETLRTWVEEGIVEYLGEAEDVRPHIKNANCIVLPSYREGTSRVLLEASAMGRPMIVADVPGCRNIVDHGQNGFLCRARDAGSLADQMLAFLELSPRQRQLMGHKARTKATAEFDVRHVTDRYLQAIDGVTGAQSRSRRT